MKAVSPNVTVIEESSIPMVVTTTNSEGNMEATNADGSNFKVSPFAPIFNHISNSKIFLSPNVLDLLCM